MIITLKRHKAAGENGITFELYKGGNEIPINYLTIWSLELDIRRLSTMMLSSYKKEKCNKCGNHCRNNVVANIMTAFS